MSSEVTANNPGDVYELNLRSRDNQGYDYLDPSTLTHQDTDKKMIPRENPKPQTPIHHTYVTQPASQVGPLLEKIASLKKVIAVLIFVIVVYGILLLILGLINFGVIGPSKEAGREGPVGPEGPRGLQGPVGNTTGTSGAVYVRWGRTTCPEVSEIIYAGIAGGKWYDHPGSGSNYLCLPDDPEYDDYVAGDDASRGLVYTAEYQGTNFRPYEDLFEHDVPCAVCSTTNRGEWLMIPAKMTCPSAWTKEYNGYLMTAQYGHPGATEFVCVDRNPEVVPGSISDVNGVLFYPVEGRCSGHGNLPCSPYISGAELSCVVCSK